MTTLASLRYAKADAGADLHDAIGRAYKGVEKDKYGQILLTCFHIFGQIFCFGVKIFVFKFYETFFRQIQVKTSRFQSTSYQTET